MTFQVRLVPSCLAPGEQPNFLMTCQLVSLLQQAGDHPTPGGGEQALSLRHLLYLPGGYTAGLGAVLTDCPFGDQAGAGPQGLGACVLERTRWKRGRAQELGGSHPTVAAPSTGGPHGIHSQEGPPSVPAPSPWTAGGNWGQHAQRSDRPRNSPRHRYVICGAQGKTKRRVSFLKPI